MVTTRIVVWLLLLSLSAIMAFAYGWVTDSFDAASWWRVGLFPGIGLAGILSVFVWPQFTTNWAVRGSIWIPAILLRLLILPTAVSDDVNRYLFEGKLVRAQISPYAQTADATALIDTRDAHWQAINHKDQPSAYPPLAQLIFAVVGGLSYQTFTYKCVFVLADLLTLGAVLHLLQRRGLSPAFAGLYALNPLILIAYAGEAHFDSLMVAALLWALYVYEVGRNKSALTLLALATGIKWITLPLIPFFIGKRLLPGCLIVLLILLLPAVYFVDSIESLVPALLKFGGTRSFNGLVYDSVLLSMGLPRLLCNGIVLVLFMAIVLWRWCWRARVPLDSHLRWILGALIVLSPTVHFWYLGWILPLICLRPSLPWLTFSLSGGLYFCVWINASAETAWWGLYGWQQWLFWGPFVLACMYELWSTHGRIVWPVRRTEQPDMPRVSVVIPTLNAASQLPNALRSIEQQSFAAVSEVIIVDAGSTDRTIQVAEKSPLPLRVLHADRGRGDQIAAGIHAARSEWVVILHADAMLSVHAMASLMRAIEVDCTVIGGALGQRFVGNNPELVPIELLNELRVVFTRTAFGDQVQFFHRDSAIRYELMPKQPLMEDVESSWRTRERGSFLFLCQACQVSHQKWNPNQYLARFRLVMRMVGKYRWARWRSRRQAEVLSEALYTEYYSN